MYVRKAREVVIAVTLLAVWLSFRLVASAQDDKANSWRLTIADQDEPGERMIVSGIVYDSEKRAPIEGATVYVYHTDKDGYYNRSEGNRGSSQPRLKGTMITNDKGQYEYDTIKPGPYPDERIAAHVHYIVSAPGYRERRLDLVFAGDRFLTDRMRSDNERENGYYKICEPVKNDKGVLICGLDIYLTKS